MSITDELRKWAREQRTGNALTCYPPKYEIHGVEEDVLAIADRIDAEHQKATAGCIHYDPERHYCAVHGDTEHGWVKLPVDADGVPIHVGDVVMFLDLYGSKSKPFVVEGFESPDMWLVRYEEGHRYTANPAYTRHHHAPTVEDVLEEFAQMYIACNDKGTIAEYAAKLRLKEDA